MKRVVNIILSMLCMVFFLGFVGCFQKEPVVLKETDTYIVITVSNEQMSITDDTTLVEYMYSLQEDGELDFAMSNGMVSSVNGIENASDWSSCWMLYTSDADNANTAWGEVEYKGKVYGSAIVGADSLVVKADCLYIWIYQSF